MNYEKNEIDVFEKYYSFDKLDKENFYYEAKKENYNLVKEAYFSNKADIKTLPLRTTIQSTDYCNLKCIMCQIHSQEEKHSLRQMEQKNFDKIVEKLFPTLIEAHPTNIGEPMISPWFDYLCQKTKEYGVLLDITSNGTLMTEEKIRNILPSLLDIKVSFDGFKKETFEKIRKGADYNKLIENIDNFVRLRKDFYRKPTITLQVTLFTCNYKELPDIIRFAKERGIDRVKAYHVFSYSEEIDKVSLILNIESFEEVRNECLHLAKELDLKIEIAELPSNKPAEALKDLVHQKCRLPWAESFIDYDGSVYPCHSHNHIALGNIFTQTAEEVWNSEYAQFLRNGLINKKTENTICFNCGNNFIRINREAAVPYNKDDFLFKKTGDKNLNWGKRCKQFLLDR